MEPQVDHVVTCSLHWISIKYHGLIGKCVGSIKKIWFPYQPRPENGRILPLWMQGIELCQLGSMVETPRTLDKGCVQ